MVATYSFGNNLTCKTLRFFGSFILLVSFLNGTLMSQNDSIVIGTIEGSLSRKQIPVDLGRTNKALTPLIGKAITVHGGLRLSNPNSSLYSVTLSAKADNSVSSDCEG